MTNNILYQTEWLIIGLKKSRTEYLIPFSEEAKRHFIQFEIWENINLRIEIEKLLGLKFNNKKMKILIYALNENYMIQYYEHRPYYYSLISRYTLKEDLILPCILLLLRNCKEVYHHEDYIIL